jgi:hypothetical protein
MRKKALLSLIFVPIFFTLALAQNLPTPGRVCDGSQLPDGTYIPAGQVREVVYGGVRYRCVGCGGCTPISSGSSAKPMSQPYIPPVPTSQQLAIGLMGAFLSGFFSGLSQDMLTHSQAYQKQREQEEYQRRLAEEQKRQEEKKKQLLAQYNSLLAKAQAQSKQQVNTTGSQLTFQSLGGQLTPFQWQSPIPTNSKSSPAQPEENLITSSDLNRILGNIIFDKVMEKMEEKIDDYGGKIIERLDKRYGKEWGSKYYGKGLPIAKIVVTAKTEGIAQAGAETIDFGISMIPMPTLVSGVADLGRKIYTKVSFMALDKFLTKSEEACNFLGLNCNKEEFLQDFESEMNVGQKIIYKWLKGD